MADITMNNRERECDRADCIELPQNRAQRWEFVTMVTNKFPDKPSNYQLPKQGTA
jgi:hypothetical protein